MLLIQMDLINKVWQAVICLSITVLFFVTPSSVLAQDNPTFLENQQQGSGRWKLDKPADDVNLQIKGYASATSVNKGDTITLFISTSPAQQYDIEIYRAGWYSGWEGRFITKISSLNGFPQSIPPSNPVTGLLELDWSPSYVLSIPSGWTSGLYLAKLINDNGYDNYIMFVVRDDDREADFLFQQSVNTHQAYNPFPDNNSTGKSLYESRSYGEDTIAGSPRAVKVSFDRPYSGNGAGDYFRWEHDTIVWMERVGYDVTYSTNIDTHENGDDLQNHEVFVSAGHDEYWTGNMFDAVENARDNGTHLAFVGANAGYFQVRFEDSALSRPNRVMVSYKNANIDPEPEPTRKTIEFSEIGRPEQSLRGVMYNDFNAGNNTDYIVENSGHWIYNQTGLTNGDRILDIIGYEVDTYFSWIPKPNHTSWAILTSSPFLTKRGNTIEANTVLYRAPSGAWVFSSGTMSWSNALNAYWEEDSRLQQMTTNLFARFINSNNAPIVTNPGDQTSLEDETVSLNIQASNPGGGTLTYRAENLPSGLSINATTGRISGQFIPNRIRAQRVSVTVSNNSDSTTVFFTWQVNRGNAGACRVGTQEAEWGRIYGNFQIMADSDASGNEYIGTQFSAGAHVFVPDDRIEYCFTINEGGNYRLRGWAKAPEDRHDSFYVTIDGQPSGAYLWNVQQSNQFTSDYLSDEGGADPVVVNLSPGQHGVIIYQHESIVGLDRLALERTSDDPSDGVPGGITLIAPQGTVFDSTPSFRWSQAENATKYKLLVRNLVNDEIVLNQVFTLDQVACSQDTCAISPNVTLDSANHKWNVQAQNDSAIGEWSPNMNFVVSVTGQRLGDVNCDSAVNSIDAMFILQYTVGLRTDHGRCPLDNPLTQLHLELGDVNGDGAATSLDSLQIVQCDAGLNNSFCP